MGTPRGVLVAAEHELRDDDTEWLSVDSSCVRASIAAAGAKKSDGTGGQTSEALSRSRGGFGTKIRVAVTPMGHLVTLELTGSEASDSPTAPRSGPLVPSRVSHPGRIEWSRSSTTGTFTRNATWSSGTSRGSSSADGLRPDTTRRPPTSWASFDWPRSRSCSRSFTQRPRFSQYGLTDHFASSINSAEEPLQCRISYDFQNAPVSEPDAPADTSQDVYGEGKKD